MSLRLRTQVFPRGLTILMRLVVGPNGDTIRTQSRPVKLTESGISRTSRIVSKGALPLDAETVAPRNGAVIETIWPQSRTKIVHGKPDECHQQPASQDLATGAFSRPLIMGMLVIGMLLLLMVGAIARAALPPGGTFADDNGNVHEGNIEAIAAAGITKGCTPPPDALFCPNRPVTRGQMAAFLARALDLPATATDFFIDDDDSIFESDINRMAAAGVTKGCNPSEGNTKYCPDGKVTRGQMAAFMVRAFGYTDSGAGNLFSDDDGSVFEADIDRLGTAGVTKGCNPPTNDRFCPTAPVLRDQMASFFARALGLDPIVVPPPAVPVFTIAWGSSGSGSDQLDFPHGIDVAPDGTVYVADTGNERVQVFSPTGTLLDSWPRPGDNPIDVAVAQDGSVYVDCGQSSPWKQEVCHYSPDGTLLSSFGTEYAPSAGYWRLAVAPDGSVFALAAFSSDRQVVHFTADGQFIDWWGNSGPLEENFDATGIAVSSDGTVYVANYRGRIFRFTPEGTFIDSFQLRNVLGLTEQIKTNYIDIGPDDTIYVADESGRILRFTADGGYLGGWGTAGTDEGEFRGLNAVAAGTDAVYTTEKWVDRVQKFTYP